MSWAEGYDDGWNEALDALIDRLNDANGTLTKMAVEKLERGHESDHDRLRGKASGVRLALDYARTIRRNA